MRVLNVYYTVSQSVSQSVSGTLERPQRLAVMCDPPGVVGVEPSVVLDLLHPRSAESSSLALPLLHSKLRKSKVQNIKR